MLPPTGQPISMANIRAEFGGAGPISLSTYYGGLGKVPRGLAGVPISGPLRLGNFRGRFKSAFWVDAADSDTLATTSGDVTSWTSKAGDGYSLTPNDPARPQLSSAAGGLSTLAFTGSQCMQGPSTFTVGSSNTTAFFVGSLSGGGSYSRGFSFQGVGDGQTYGRDNSGIWVLRNAGTNSIGAYKAQMLSVASITPPNAFIACSKFDPFHTMYVNSAPSTPVGGTNVLDVPGKLCIGNDGTLISTDFWVGDISEVLLFASALTDSERQQIEGYLAHKWGLAGVLPGGHPYKSSSPLPA